MKLRIFCALIMAGGLAIADTTIPLTGSGATEASGNGFALRVPNLDGVGTDSEGCILFNPLQYTPISIFDMGTLTYDETKLTGSGAESLPVEPGDVVFTFENYANLLCQELAVIGTCGATVTLSNIGGQGLSFVDGQVDSLDFTADVEWTITLNGFAQTAAPYQGKLTVIEGAFVFDLSDDPQSWFIGAPGVSFEFDLVARPDVFGGPTLPIAVANLSVATVPALRVRGVGASDVSLEATFPDPGPGLFRLTQSPDLHANSWTRVGCEFASRTEMRSFIVSIPDGATRIFYRLELVGEGEDPDNP